MAGWDSEAESEIPPYCSGHDENTTVHVRSSSLNGLCRAAAQTHCERVRRALCIERHTGEPKQNRFNKSAVFKGRRGENLSSHAACPETVITAECTHNRR